MVEKKTNKSNTNSYIKYRRNRVIVSNNILNRDDLHLAISIIKEIRPNLNLANYAKLKRVIDKEFDSNVKIEDIEKYFQPSIEGLIDDYEYKLKMSNYE